MHERRGHDARTALGLAAVTAAIAGCASADKAPPAGEPRGSAAVEPGAGTGTGTSAGTAGSAGGVAAAPATAACEGRTGDVLTFRETTSNQLAQRDVGVSNVFERELPDASGAVAKRMSAVLVVHDPATDAVVRATVFAGSVVDIGAERFCVVTVALGGDAPGSVSLVKLGS